MKITPINSFAALAVSLLGFGLAPQVSAESTVYLDTGFTSNSNQLPNNSAWFRNGGSGFTVGGGSLTFNPDNNSRESLTYVTAAGAGNKINVAEGMQLTLSFTLSGSGLVNSGGNFRIGLFDSGSATRISGNGFGSNTTLEDYTGYAMVTNLRSGSATATGVYARDPGMDVSNLLHNLNAFEQLGDGTPGAGFGATVSSVSGHFTITNYGASGVVISYSLGDKLIGTYTDTEWEYTTFDTIGLVFRKGDSDANPTLSFSNMKLELTQIPEPGAVTAVLAGAGLFAAVMLRRRARRA